MLRLVVLGALVVAASGQTTEVSQCTRNQGDLPINAYIQGCTIPPCGLPVLEDAVITIIFRAPRTIRSMTTLASAYLPGILTGIPYPLRENAVTCNFLDNSYCPVLEGEIIQYTLHMFIQPSFQVSLPPTIEFRIVDDNGTSFICIRVPLNILDPRSNQATHNGTLVGENN